MFNRKQSILLATALTLLVLLGCLLDHTDAKRSRSKSRHRPKGVNIEIYHPKGVMVWYPYRTDLELFGIEIYINKNDAAPETASSSEEVIRPVCDICLNTTEVSYGKFILRSENAIIRGRDRVTYRAILKKTNSEPRISSSNEFYVSESRILLGSVTGEAIACNSATSEPRIGESNGDDKALRDEIKLLEDILLEVNQECSASQNQTKQLHLIAETPTRYNAAELYEFAINWLTSALPSVNWNRTMVDAFYVVNGGIGIEVATIIDKLKILKMAQGLADHPITDLDTFQSEEFTNEIDMW
ncbi:uncharacterized protein LOC125951561 [Anopheles darlingi]|uniref:uncharacterized protein LOC125951561 n=1 Tax=Anopheles darlingi TaxID=43151 RepID=UPI0021000A0F|nr:uncharacterized protein LOC125951561 [Anopheles darlingi]